MGYKDTRNAAPCGVHGSSLRLEYMSNQNNLCILTKIHTRLGIQGCAISVPDGYGIAEEHFNVLTVALIGAPSDSKNKHVNNTTIIVTQSVSPRMTVANTKKGLGAVCAT